MHHNTKVAENHDPHESDDSISLTADESKSVDPIDQFSKVAEFNIRQMSYNPEINAQLNIMNMIQALDRKV